MKPEETGALQTVLDSEEFGKAIGDAVAAGIAATQPPRKMSIGEYNRRERQRNPKPKFREGLTVRQQGNVLQEDFPALTANAIKAINKFTRSGRYLNNLVEVLLTKQGLEETLDIFYNNKSIDQRMENKSYFKSFEDLVTQVAEAQAAEDAEDAKYGKKR